MVYITPQAAPSDLCENLKCSQTGNPDVALIVTGDFNQVNHKKVKHDFHQYIDCTTSGIDTLDHNATCHSKMATEWNSDLHLGMNDHAAIDTCPW